MRLDLERHGPALADIDDAGVLTDPDKELVGLGLLVAELAQVHLARLVRAVLGPHDAVHRELAARGAAAEDLADLGVLGGLESELGERLLAIGVRDRVGDGVAPSLGGAGAHASTRPFNSEVKNPRPSVVGPVSASTACSG